MVYMVSKLYSSSLYETFLLYFVCMQERGGVYAVGDFMTRKEDLHVVKPTTTVDEGICYA